MGAMPEAGPPGSPTQNHLARMVLMMFLLTFVVSRVVVFLIMSSRIPDIYLHLGGTHVHHLNYGIFLLSGVGLTCSLPGQLEGDFPPPRSCTASAWR